jgi:ATP-binding cassette subfamily C protein PrsD
MLQVYDRVLTSGSVATLVGLSLLLLLAYSLQGILDGIRVRMLTRIGARFDEQVSPAAFAATQRLSLLGLSAVQAQQPIRDLDQIRAFLSSLGPTALFDMPWMPLFIAGCFVLHPWLGWLAIGGALVIVSITLLTEAFSRTANRKQLESGLARQSLADSSVRNAEALTAMGMTASFQQQWTTANGRLVRDCLEGSDATSGLGTFAKVFRMVLQSAVLGLGAFLAIRGEVSGGAMIAASIMTSRALAPLEIAVAHWKSFIASRQGLARLREVLETPSLADRQRTQLPTPQHSLTAMGLIVSAPGRALPILQGVSVDLRAGQGLAVIGPSASGKSTLARALVGVWRPLKGDVRLDGATYDQWARDHLGKHIGYLPQDIELFDGTVADNIARFDREAQHDAIVAAARAAGAHDLILKLDEGYDTRIGEAGSILSGGQRQRIALARACMASPFSWCSTNRIRTSIAKATMR